MRYDAASDRYLPVSWADAFAEIGRELRAIEDPKSVVFYSSGRCSNEASYLYGCWRGCTATTTCPTAPTCATRRTSVALPESIGVPVGTVTLDDFEPTDCIMFFGQNVGSNSPRMLHALQHASERGVPIIVYNPLRERGLESFINPQSPTEMLTRQRNPHRLAIPSGEGRRRPGGTDRHLQSLVELNDAARATAVPTVLDHAFISEHTQRLRPVHCLAAPAGMARTGTPSRTAARGDGGDRRGLCQIARATMGIYGMGLTQHRAGVETVQMLVNLLLLRGNIGRSGAGICPVRGHSNVQGQRTVGITEKPALVPLDRLAEQYHFSPPRETGIQYRRGLRSDPCRQDQGLHHAGRQFRACHPRPRPDGTGMAAACGLP